MLESSMKLSNKNDLLGILMASTCLTTNNPGAQIEDTHTVQSGTGDAAGNGDPLPFHEILGQKITKLRVLDMHNSEKANHIVPGLSTAELLSGNSEEMDTSELQKILMGERSQSNEKNFNTPSTYTKKNDEGLEQDVSGNQTSGTILSLAILPETLVAYSQTDIQNTEQNLPLQQGDAGVNVRFGIYMPFILNAKGKDSSLFSQTRGQTGADDTMQDRLFGDANTSGILYNGETSPARSDVGGPNPTQKIERLQTLDMSAFSTIPESIITDTDRKAIDMMRLPTAFKTLAQNLSAENMHNVLITGTENPADTAEIYAENDLSKAMSKVSSQNDILNTPQTNEESDLFDRSGSKQNTFDLAHQGTDTQKTNSKVPFAQDNQTAKDNTQANSFTFQQKTETFPGGDVTALSSLDGLSNKVSHTFHESSPADIAHTYSSSIEQFFKDIRLVNHGDKISLVNHGGRSEIKLNLTPPELGSVEIHFTEENDEIKAKIFVENAEVKAAIEDNVHRLKESVAASGFEIHKVEVYIQNDNASKEKSFNNSEENNQQHQTRGQDRMNGDHSMGEDTIVIDVQKTSSVKTSNVMVDYII